MPSQNVETVRRAHEALNTGDVEALVALCDAGLDRQSEGAPLS